VFLEDVPNIAKAGDVKEVASGYGRNFLIPRKLAVLVNPGAASQLEAQRRAQAKKQSQVEAEITQMASQLEGKEVILKAKVGAKDRLFGSITSADIAAELEKTSGVIVDRRKIELDEPIRRLGSFSLAIRLANELMPKIKVTVVEEEPS
ncbi:MAG: 50S ribosomal protein L9, partial [Dehalococcoidales bacterium]